MPQSGIIETASGDLLVAGFITKAAFEADGFYDPLIHTVREDVPVPAMRRGDRSQANMHRWISPDWTEVAQPTVIVYPSRVVGMTEIQRDAIPNPVQGFICNEDTIGLEFYANEVWNTVGGGSPGLVLIETQTAADDSSLDFTTGIVQGSQYKFVFHGLIPTTNNDEINMRMSYDAGLTWEDGAAEFEFVIASGTAP